MGVNKSITIDGFTFQFEVNGVMHVSLYSGDMENRPFTDQELKF